MAFSRDSEMYFSSYKYWTFFFVFIKAVVADNNSANVNAFNILLDKFKGDKKYISIPNSPQNICFLILYIYKKIFGIV